MALGFVATSVGVTGFILTYFVNLWLKSYGFFAATCILTAGFALCSFVGCRFAHMAPAQIESYFETNEKVQTVRNYGAGEMVKTKEFLLMFLYLTVAMISYRMVTPMTITMGMDRNVSNEVCVMITLACTIANTYARFFIPILSEKISGNRMLVVLFVLDASASLLLIFAAGWLYVICVPVLALCFGGFIGIDPVLAADYFGTENAGQNNSILTIVSDEKEHTGSKFFNMRYPLGMKSREFQDNIYKIRRNIIMGLVEEDSCIIVGRCSDAILENYKNALHIYIYAPFEERLNNCVNDLGMNKTDAVKMITEVDKARDAYHKKYAKFLPSDSEHKDLLIDSSLLGAEGTAKVIAGIVKEKFNV